MFSLMFCSIVLAAALSQAEWKEVPRLRGAMMSTRASAEDIRAVRALGANLVRWQLTWDGFPKGPADYSTLAEYRAWLDSALAHFDSVLPVLEEQKIRVVLDLHTPPGGRNQWFDVAMFGRPELEDEFVAIWERLAKRYKGRRAIWAFDLLNEPSTGRPDPDGEWRKLAMKAIAVIRKADPGRRIIYGPAAWSGASTFQGLQPLAAGNIVYTFHFYDPSKFTHQGVFENPMGFDYPGTIDGNRWDKAALKEALAPVIEFQKRAKAPIYVGEFSAIRWAPNGSALRWLQDAIDLFEEQGWHWSYHAFREWQGWSVEHGEAKEDEARSAAPGARHLLLKRALSKNRH